MCAHTETGIFWDKCKRTVILKSFAKHMDRAKNFCFTSYNEEPIPFDDETMSFLVQQREICPSTGRGHWQGTLVLKNPRTFTGIKRMLPNAHIEKCRNLLKSIEYCRKEESREPGTEPLEFGLRPLDDDWRATPYEELWNTRPNWMLRNWRAVREYQTVVAKPRARPNHKLTVYYGQPGTGKSYKAYNENPEAYSKDGTKWWDGYNGEKTIIWDDFAGTVPFRDFLRWSDKYPQRVEVKGGSIALNNDLTIVTTNVMPQNWYPNCDFQCIKRRIHEFYEFNNDFSCRIVNEY